MKAAAEEDWSDGRKLRGAWSAWNGHCGQQEGTVARATEPAVRAHRKLGVVTGTSPLPAPSAHLGDIPVTVRGSPGLGPE